MLLPGHEEEPLFSPALRKAGRILAAVGGLGLGTAMLVIGGLYAGLTTCVDPDSQANVCGDIQGLVVPLELVLVLGGTAAAVAGGIGTAATGRARWIAGGLAIMCALALLLDVLGAIQQPVQLFS